MDSSFSSIFLEHFVIQSTISFRLATFLVKRNLYESCSTLSTRTYSNLLDPFLSALMTIPSFFSDWTLRESLIDFNFNLALTSLNLLKLSTCLISHSMHLSIYDDTIFSLISLKSSGTTNLQLDFCSD